MPQDSELELVLETLDPAEAAIVRSLLEAAGIPFMVRGEDRFDVFRGAFRGTVFSRKGRPISFLVDRSRLDEACDLLASESPLSDADEDPGNM
jgi:Putative prokaryotic signal transducing protein